MLPSATNAVQYNFGEVNISSLSGLVWFDQNQNGVIDVGDSYLGGVSVTLIGVDDQNHAVTMTTTTAANGTYVFNGLRPGNYAITETPPQGYDRAAQLLGSLGGLIGNRQFLSIAVQAGQSGVQYDFGEIQNKIDNIITPPPPFVPINIDITFLSKLQLLSNSQQILAQATQFAYYVDGVYTVTLGRHADMGGLSSSPFSYCWERRRSRASSLT